MLVDGFTEGNGFAGSLSPDEWTASLSAPPILDSRRDNWSTARVQLWRGLEPVSYPPLDHHCLTMHLGTPRHIRRRGEGRLREASVRPGDFSFTPAGAAFDWHTTGPVDYAELYVSPEKIRSLWGDLPDGSDPFTLQDRLGVTDKLIEALFDAMLKELAQDQTTSSLYLDSLFSSLWLRLSAVCKGVKHEDGRFVAVLTAKRLKRVLEYIEQNLAMDLTVAELASVAALSPFHFSRAFAAAAGTSPYAYLVARRIECAQRMLSQGGMSVSEATTACGFRTSGQFARMFKRIAGVSPERFQRGYLSSEAARRRL